MIVLLSYHTKLAIFVTWPISVKIYFSSTYGVSMQFPNSYFKNQTPYQLTAYTSRDFEEELIPLRLSKLFSLWNNNSFQNCTHSNDHTWQTIDTPGLKPFTKFIWGCTLLPKVRYHDLDLTLPTLP